MNETLKRRLVGLAVLLGGLLLLSLVLPGPGPLPASGDDMKRVTLDLRASTSVSELSPVVTPTSSTMATPEPASAAEPDPITDTEPDLEVPTRTEPTGVTTAEPHAIVGKPKTTVHAAPATPVKPPKASASIPSHPSKPTSPAVAPWYVQLGAFSDITKARQLLQIYKGKTFPGLVSPVQTTKGVLYRVWIGPYHSHDLAASAQKRLDKVGVHGTKLIQG